jgi:hypothetical protein
MEFSRCARPLRAAVSQNSTAFNVEVDVLLGDLVVRTAGKPAIDGPGASGVMAPDSLERR